jgi:hypothetical protein
MEVAGHIGRQPPMAASTRDSRMQQAALAQPVYDLVWAGATEEEWAKSGVRAFFRVSVGLNRAMSLRDQRKEGGQTLRLDAGQEGRDHHLPSHLARD